MGTLKNNLLRMLPILMRISINKGRCYQAVRHPIRFFSPSSVNNTKSTVSIKVKRKIAQPEFPGGTKKAYATQNQVACPLSLNPKAMFNPGTNPGYCPVPLR
jgi:hypothetical protein